MFTAFFIVYYPFLIRIFFTRGISSDKAKKTYLILTIGLFAIMLSLRHYEMFPDKHYYFYPPLIANESWNDILSDKLITTDYAIGINILIKLLSYISKENVSQLFFAFTSCVSLFLLGRFIYRYSKNVFLSVVVFIINYPWFVQLIRQFFVATILLTAVDVLISKEKPKNIIVFVILNVICVFLHPTAIIGFVFLPFYYFRKNSKHSIILFAVVIVLALFSQYLLDIFATIIPQINYYLSRYLGNDLYYNTTASISKLTSVNVLVGLIAKLAFEGTIIILYLKSNKRYQLNGANIKKQETVFFQIVLLSFMAEIFFLVASVFVNILNRVSIYFFFTTIIAVPYIISAYPKAKNIIYIGIFLISLYTLLAGVPTSFFSFGGYSYTYIYEYTPFWADVPIPLLK